ncbi:MULTISPECIES: tRNA lysidine(34) synthetase TilS [Methylorubrum]|uniref:tRNA(Ile)-lysidine synthase n=2 Tax=Methylorubrum extorquens TaxID=408 RepID=C5AW38_METEA|nr:MULTISPECIES: tRNA lysidine(34) synthetase TilS [Methylorubrum]ACS42901.1 tRNA(Ile)-lysidine synthase (tRNA(Ile)-lysidine synthetase, tRNA(Ile)-2-lysyl-cytidine synthase); YaeN protein [Methylorubrum extorquens AM1]MCP1544032.1 tRNA(Ile)-lysidine synthase [Methylorubrum extorquens]MCP1588622.1 tRNA(Ile)-lysidine synthase [Methylorubrum extorquens]
MSAAPASLDDRLARALAPLLEEPARPALLAVSGGPDSTALMHAAARAGRDRFRVATVDHALRPGSADEALGVGRLATELGLVHTILTWDAPRHGSRIQASARGARYRLLTDHAAGIGAGLILTAHTLDDQAETVLMRLIAGSGPSGLAGMREERVLAPGIRLVRPFLSLSKADLVAYCEMHRLPFLRDPSNTDERFTRARLRRLLPLLAEEGLNAARLARLAVRAGRDDAALRQRAEAVLSEITRTDEAALRLDGLRLRREPCAIVLRVVDAALDTVAPAHEAPVPKRLERLEALVLDALLPALAEGRALRRTLRGVLIEADGEGTIRLVAAPPRRARDRRR